MNKIQNGSLVIIMKPNNLTNYPNYTAINNSNYVPFTALTQSNYANYTQLNSCNYIFF